MTQQPQFGYYAPPPYRDPLAPARRASTMLFILGILMAAFGLCNLVSVAGLSPADLEKQMRLFQKDQPLPFSIETFKVVAIVMHGGIVLGGLVLLALGIPVRGGSTTATVGAMIITGIILLLLLFLGLASIVAVIIAPLAGAVMICMVIVPLVLFALLFFWLIQALRASRAAKTATQQYAAQYWQYYQQQQQQPAYGYGPYAP